MSILRDYCPTCRAVMDQGACLRCEVERLREALEFCRDTSDDEERARVANAALVASGEQA